MAKLLRYEDFLDRVDELGFMALSKSMLPGFPALNEETPGEIWHTGDPDTDPWCWKDRAAEEKRLAFGCILGGHKGFVSARMYHLFYTAFNPQEHMEERRADGEISQTVWQLWQLFERNSLLDTSEIRQEMGVTQKKGSRVDRAIVELQQYFYITVAGNRRKTDKFGQPYGWPANVYNKVENWTPTEWIKLAANIEPDEAREVILDRGLAISRNTTRNELARALGIK